MKIIMGARKSGKTTKLIRYAYAENLRIVCAIAERVLHICNLAKKLGLKILRPITINTLIQKYYFDDFEKGYAYDEVFDCFYQLLPARLNGKSKLATFNYEHGEV